MSLAAWAVLVWFGAPAAFVSGAIAALIARSHSGSAWLLAIPIAAAAPWLLITSAVRTHVTPWLLLLLTAWSAGCLIASAAVNYRRS